MKEGENWRGSNVCSNVAPTPAVWCCVWASRKCITLGKLVWALRLGILEEETNADIEELRMARLFAEPQAGEPVAKRQLCPVIERFRILGDK